MPLLQPDLVQRLTAALLHIVQTLPATAFPRSQVGNGSGTHLYAYLSICAVISGKYILVSRWLTLCFAVARALPLPGRIRPVTNALSRLTSGQESFPQVMVTSPSAPQGKALMEAGQTLPDGILLERYLGWRP